MNLNLDNSKIFIKVFLTLMLSTVFIMSTSYTTNYLYEQFFSEFHFSSGAAIGPVSVEGLTRSETVEKLDQAVKSWRSNPILILNWNGKDLPVSPSTVIFDIPKSVEQAAPAGASGMILSLSKEALDLTTSELLGKDEVVNLDHTALEKAIKDLAASLPTEQVSISLKDYLNSRPLPATVVSKGIVTNKEKKQVQSSLLTKLNGHTIQPGDSVSLLSFVQKKPLSDAELYTLNLAASGIYQMLLHTNFEIMERHLGRTIPKYTELGFEASVIPDHWDLVFKNPNPTPYTLKAFYKNDQLEVSLEGVALPGQFQPYLLEKKELQPKTIIHMNPHLLYDEVETKEPGKPGYSVVVYRHKLQGKKLVGKEWISEDFYPAVPRLEERGPSTPVVPEMNEQQGNNTDTEQQDSINQPSNESDWVILN